jgi:hypothetical protein
MVRIDLKIVIYDVRKKSPWQRWHVKVQENHHPFSIYCIGSHQMNHNMRAAIP